MLTAFTYKLQNVFYQLCAFETYTSMYMDSLLCSISTNSDMPSASSLTEINQTIIMFGALIRIYMHMKTPMACFTNMV